MNNIENKIDILNNEEMNIKERIEYINDLNKLIKKEESNLKTILSDLNSNNFSISKNKYERRDIDSLLKLFDNNNNLNEQFKIYVSIKNKIEHIKKQILT